ncbi:MAG: hypothetical protein IKW06_02475 [Clostridia bacterium]|nr:hypothetical protein [Clostridia bacterium]
MAEDGSKLLENIMGMLGDNPTEKLGEMLSALTENNSEEKKEEPKTETHDTIGTFDPAMLLKLQSLMGQLNNQNKDERSALLYAIKPFLSEERRPQIDQMIKFLRLSSLAKTAQEMDLFKELL